MTAKKGKAKTLPEWFPLSCYRKKLKPEQWLAHLTFRLVVRTTFNNGGDEKRARELFDSLIVQKECKPEDADGLLNDKPRWPVANLNIYEAFYLAAQRTPDERSDLRQLSQRLVENPQENLAEFFDKHSHGNNGNFFEDALKTAEDEKAGGYQAESLSWRLPVSIDISQDDETLKLAFDVWLAGVRSSQRELPPKTVDKKELQRWHDFGLLAAFDLKLWGEITGHHCTDATIGHALWPDQNPDTGFVDTTERYRKTTKPLLDKVFTWGMIEKMANDMSMVRFIKAVRAEALANGETVKPWPEED